VLTVTDLVLRLTDCFDLGAQGLSEARFRSYVSYLSDIPLPVLENGIDTLICTRTEDRLPTIGMIRSVCAELVSGLPTEAEALRQIDDRIFWARAREGDCPRPHPLVAEALRQIGGINVLTHSEQPAITRAQFARIYRDLRAAEITALQAPHALTPQNELAA
jgi:hypothetical protein